MSINLMDGFIMKCVDWACDGRLAYQLAHFLLLCRASQRRNISSSSIVQSIFHLASQSICCAYVKHPFPLSHFAHVNSGFPLAPTWIRFLFASQDLPWRCAIIRLWMIGSDTSDATRSRMHFIAFIAAALISLLPKTRNVGQLVSSVAVMASKIDEINIWNGPTTEQLISSDEFRSFLSADRS